MKFPFWATTLTFFSVVILIGLGSWQLYRLAWKTELLAQIEVEHSKSPMDFELTYENLSFLNKDQLFVRGFVEGVYLHKHELALGPRTYKGAPGYHIITPFETLDSHIVLVNRGWVPLDMTEADFLRPEEPLIITGTARKPERANSFVPKNSPAQGAWYRLDPEEIAQAKSLQAVLPYVLYVDGESKGEYPVATATKWQPHNKHLGYALFWFTMAGVLLVIYYFRFIRKKS